MDRPLPHSIHIPPGPTLPPNQIGTTSSFFHEEVAKCSEVLQCNDGTSNKVSNIIRRHTDNRKLLLIHILLLSHSLLFFRFLFYQYMVVFLFNTVIYVFLL